MDIPSPPPAPPKPRAHTVTVAGEKLAWKRDAPAGGFAKTPRHLCGWSLHRKPSGGVRAWFRHTHGDPLRAPPEGTLRGWCVYVLVPTTPEERAAGKGDTTSFRGSFVVLSEGGDEGVATAMALAEKILAKRMAEPGRVPPPATP